jgi:hypothetical protein
MTLDTDLNQIVVALVNDDIAVSWFAGKASFPDTTKVCLKETA